MKIPKEMTIRKSIRSYARKMGFSIISNPDNSYNLWDVAMGYTTHRSVNMDTIVRVVIDHMYAKKYREEHSLAMGG